MTAPGDVFLGACEQIAVLLGEAGFRFARSGPHASRRSPPFVHRLVFETSKFNRREEYVELRISAAVEAPDFREWLAAQPWALRQDSWIAGGDIGLFLPPGDTRCSWNIAELEARHVAVSEARRIVAEHVEPFFSLFGGRDSVVRTLAVAGIHGLPEARAVELLAWLEAPAAAARYVNWTLAQEDALAASFRHWLTIYRRDGLIDPGADPAGGKALAFVVAANEIPVG